jgi:hypothetical protein
MKETILEKAIEKACKNNFGFFGLVNGEAEALYHDELIIEKHEINGKESYIFYAYNDDCPGDGGVFFTFRDIIFDHEFAKAFWGNQRHSSGKEWGICKCCNVKFDYDELDTPDTHTELCWQYHLQQMVLEEDPIKYLEQFLD